MFDPQKLTTNLIPPATFVQPIQGRKYTLTHSDITGELFLDIGTNYNYKAIDWDMRDEVLAEWQIDQLNRVSIVGKAHVDEGQFTKEQSKFRYNIFRKEMSTALKGMFYGDKKFLTNYPTLLNAPIYIMYTSIYPEFNHTIYYGTPRDYLN
ncbi:staygreen family protein [Halalkalibacter alkaliphilus]|uniref:Staygreen family protein n=1 Tax=Halalkalibacter alkaliphilus TaxID=2917993 RepID=A0A9X2CWJ1_9BACI|nr:staygreen family protein [Halalkalibacter alkaliphilus]MCL7749578.1 staygreen family protein [Halalkalibacter alkaliphilus]